MEELSHYLGGAANLNSFEDIAFLVNGHSVDLFSLMQRYFRRIKAVFH
jgi:hypothetical protein